MINKVKNNFQIVITGTDPSTNKGGIGFAIPGYLSAMKKAGIPFISIPTYSPLNLFGKYLLFLYSIPQIILAVKQSKEKKYTCIVYSHAGANLSLFREGVIMLISRIFGAKTVMQIHSPETISYLNSPVKKILFKLVLIGVDEIFVLTPWWKKTYIENGIKKPLEVIPNPLPEPWEEKANRLVRKNYNSDKLNGLVMARIVSGKGADLVVESLPFLSKGVKIDIAGDGALLDTLKARTKLLNQEEVVSFHGWVSGKEKQRLIDNADFFCHPTQLDAMPMNILEAMANGIPIIALNWGPIPDLVPDKIAGLLVNTTEPEKLSEAINDLMDPQSRQKMGEAAQQWVLDNFVAEKVGEKLLLVFSEMVKHEK